MKWKRSRKAQQESKNKDSHGNSSSSEEKIVKDREKPTPAQPTYKNESNDKTISLTSNNLFDYTKNIDQQYFTILPSDTDMEQMR